MNTTPTLPTAAAFAAWLEESEASLRRAADAAALAGDPIRGSKITALAGICGTIRQAAEVFAAGQDPELELPAGLAAPAAGIPVTDAAREALEELKASVAEGEAIMVELEALKARHASQAQRHAEAEARLKAALGIAEPMA